MKMHPFTPDTPVIIQGMTGKEGTRMADWLIKSGVNVVAGVTPGKAGQEVLGRPIFDKVGAAKDRFPDVEVTSIVAPGLHVLGAVQEAVAAGMKYIHVLTEGVPVHDVLAMRELANAHDATLLGPSSVGYLQFPKFRVGYLGGERPYEQICEGGIAVISTSGGMTNELMTALSRHGMGIRHAFALGGDRVVGTTLEEAVRYSESCHDVKVLALFVEPGRPLLRSLMSGVFQFTKPAVIFLAGEFLEDLPRGVPYGHTGTILGEDDVPVKEIRVQLRQRGIPCVGTMSEFLTACETLCQTQ